MHKIVLGKFACEKIKAYRNNKYLAIIHKVVFPLIIITLLKVIITQPEQIEIYSSNIYSYVIGMCALWFGSYLMTAILMYIPAFLFGKFVNPEIVLCENVMIYIGGSVALRYPLIYSIVWPSIKYWLGNETSQVLFVEEINSVKIEKNRSFVPFSVEYEDLKECIVIFHNKGQISTGGWLTKPEKEKIVEHIDRWLTRNGNKEG